MNPDNLPGIAAAVLLALILAGWIALDLRDRRRNKIATRELVLQLGPQLVNMVVAGECAHLWHDEEFHLCVRPYEHTGPHRCGICTEDAEARMRARGMGR